MTIYIDVPVREDRLAEVYKLLSTEPLDRATELTQENDMRDSIEPLTSDDAADDEQYDDGRDDPRWDAFWAVPDNVRDHLAPRSDLIHAITRDVAEHAADNRWITTDDIAAEIGKSPSSVASALGPLGRYLGARDLAWPFRWRYGDVGRVEYNMAPAVAAVVLDMLKAETPKVNT